MENSKSYQNETVNHPNHYAGDIECIDAMVQQFGEKATMDFCLLNAFKYLWRCEKKHAMPIEDVEKAQWYLKKYLSIPNSDSSELTEKE